MAEKYIYPKDFIRETLVKKIGEIVSVSPYLSFLLICSGIEFLGKCLDSAHKWGEKGLSEIQFNTAINKLFPGGYNSLKQYLYEDLRCGLVHQITPGSIILTQNSNDPNGEYKYEKHPYAEDGKRILIIEYFYFDFVEACKKILSMNFDNNDKMNTPILCVGNINSIKLKI